VPAQGVETDYRRLGLIAGGGGLPVRIAMAEREAGREPFVMRVTPDTDELQAFPNGQAGLAEIGGIMKTLKREGCDAVCFAGQVKRPNFAALRPDWRGAALLPKVVAAARKGDGAIIDVIVSAFEKEGFKVVGAEAAAEELLAEAGALGKVAPGTDHRADIVKGAALIEALGPFDAGQGTVIRQGFVLAIEAAEGTDAMLDRCTALPADMKGFEPGQEGRRLGVLIKMPKPGQELRVDLPTIGVPTVERAAKAGLGGIAVAAGQALIVDREGVSAAADRLGIFVYGFTADDLSPQ
jgi:DUF1009 family protein